MIFDQKKRKSHYYNCTVNKIDYVTYIDLRNIIDLMIEY